jgi:hypothetical protein
MGETAVIRLGVPFKTWCNAIEMSHVATSEKKVKSYN